MGAAMIHEYLNIAINTFTKLYHKYATAKLFNNECGLINTTDLLVATATTVILSAAVGGMLIGTLTDAKYGKAQPDAQTFAVAIAQFYKDTGKWPGQAEQAATVSHGIVPAQFLATSTSVSVFPIDLTTASGGESGSAISVNVAVCARNSSEGFMGVSISAGSLRSGATILNINDYLVHKPNDALYPNWKGPYIQEDIRTDPWDRTWVINTQPLYCSENFNPGSGIVSPTGGSSTAGALGYAWVLSGGADRTISTALSQTHLDPTGDDAGTSLGKLIMRGTGGADAR